MLKRNLFKIPNKSVDVIISLAIAALIPLLSVCTNENRDNPFDVNGVNWQHPLLALSSTSLSYSTNLTSMNVSIGNTGTTALSWTAAASDSWISLTPAMGSCNASLSNNMNVSVNRTGLKDGNYTGKVFVSSNGGNDTINVFMTVSTSTVTTIRVINYLLDSILVKVNGTTVGKVPGSDSTDFLKSNLDTLCVEYDLIKIRRSDGVALGEDISGIFNTITSVKSFHLFEIDNVVGETTYFCPVIDNQSSKPLLMAINWGSAYQVLTNSVATANTACRFGYYQLFSDTEIRAYPSGSNYTGYSYVYWLYANFSSLVSEKSGRTNLYATSSNVTW